jgi:trigger factor
VPAPFVRIIRPSVEVQIEETGPVERKLSVDIPTADVDAAFDAVYHVLRRSARIPGFRKGKVPRAIMQQYFGERARSEVMERLVSDTLPRAVEEADLQALGEPRFHSDEPPQEGTPFHYDATFDIRPTIELKQVKGLEIQSPELPEPEEDPVEQHIEELRHHQAQLVEEERGVASARGHQAVIDYEATVDGEPFEGNSATETLVELGEGRTIPGLEDQLFGLTVGQEREFDLELPEGYPVAEVAGKRAHFHVHLVGLKRRELPELDDEFAKDVSDHDTFEAFRADIESRVGEGRERELERLRREAVIEALIDANPFPVPESLVDRQLNQRIGRAAKQLAQLPQERLAELVQGWREEWRPHAERDVRLALLVPDIAEGHDIQVSDEDMDAQLRQIAEQRGEPFAQLKRSYREQGLIEALQGGLLEERVVDFLVSEATVNANLP